MSADIMEAFMRHVYEHGIKDADVIEDADMWREVLRIINDATVEGLMQSHVPTLEDNFLRELRHGNEVFSAFKVHAMDKEMQRLLIDESGKLKPFSKWRDDVEKIASHQCGAWLRTEYDTAVIRAHNAADWKEYERDKDIMPNLRWMPTTSGEPEAKHRSYWLRRVNLPVDHPFWNEHHPGDRWNCKCTLEQNDDPIVLPPSDGSDSGATPHQGLENNPGKDGHIYNDTHPYFPKSCNECAAYRASGLKNRLKLLFRNQKKDCYNCPYIDGCINKTDGFYTKNIYPNGGMLEIHTAVDTKKSDYHDIVNISQQFAKQGHSVQITPSVHFKSEEYQRIYGSLIGTKYERKCPDFSVDGIFYEYESFIKPWSKKKVSRMLTHGLEQSSRVVINNTKGCSDRYIRKQVMARIKLPGQNINEIWLYEKGRVRLLYKDGTFYKDYREA